MSPNAPNPPAYPRPRTIAGRTLALSAFAILVLIILAIMLAKALSSPPRSLLPRTKATLITLQDILIRHDTTPPPASMADFLATAPASTLRIPSSYLVRDLAQKTTAVLDAWGNPISLSPATATRPAHFVSPGPDGLPNTPDDISSLDFY